jgi:hypothetical protein
MRHWRLCLLLLLLLPGALLRGQRTPATLDGDVVNGITDAPVPAARIKLAANEPAFANRGSADFAL